MIEPTLGSPLRSNHGERPAGSPSRRHSANDRHPRSALRRGRLLPARPSRGRSKQCEARANAATCDDLPCLDDDLAGWALVLKSESKSQVVLAGWLGS
jgi:hypothetical protein